MRLVATTVEFACNLSVCQYVGERASLLKNRFTQCRFLAPVTSTVVLTACALSIIVDTREDDTETDRLTNGLTNTKTDRLAD